MATKSFHPWRGGAVAVLVGVFLAVLLAVESPLPARDEAKATALPSDLAAIPSDAVLLVSGRVATLWDSDLAKPVRRRMAKEVGEGAQEFQKFFGVPLEQAERLSMVIMDPPPAREEPLFLLHTAKPYDKDKVLAAAKTTNKVMYKDKVIYAGDKGMSIYPLDNRTLVYGAKNSLSACIDRAAPKGEGNLGGAIRQAAGNHAAVIGLNVKAFNDAVGAQLPGEVEPFKPLLEALGGTITVDFSTIRGSTVGHATLSMNFAAEKDAAAALKPLNTGLEMARAALDQGITELGKNKEMTQVVDLLQLVQDALKAAKVEQEGKALRASASLKVDAAKAAVLVLEAVQKTRGAAARAQAQNNLKQIGLALHNYHDTMNSFPPQATYDKNGKPMLSWRVFILPYIEQQELYKQFHLDEPWDSEHNKKLLAQMPKVYASPADEKSAKEHSTHFQGFFGKGAFFEGKKGISIASITDGTSNTLMIVEATKAVPWSKPEDIPFDPAKELPKLGLPGAQGFQAGFCDGSVRFISNTIKPQTLKSLITRDGGEVVDSNDF
jgi:hypothetical protein